MYNKDLSFEKFDKKVWLASPTMYPDSLKYVQEAYETNWMSTIGANINETERLAANKSEVDYAVALSCGTAALHLSVKLAAKKLYGNPACSHGALEGKRVFCSDMTFSATVNPIVYEGGSPVFIDIETETWNMDPKALKKAFELYPDVKLVIVAHLYGVPAKITEIKNICAEHGALLIEDAAESLGASYCGKQTGSFGDYSVISFNGNKIITGSSGGCFLTNDLEAANTVRKWSTQSREDAAWYQHKELGYNYRMSNVIAGVVRGQYEHLDDHIASKKSIWKRYKEGFRNIPVTMNPFDEEKCEPNYWLSAITVNPEAMCKQHRSDLEATYIAEKGKSCPTEILNAIASINAEGRPIWKPMHMQPLFADKEYVSIEGNNGYASVCEDIFARGLCLPSDNKMTVEQQNKIIEIVCACFE